MTKWTRTRTTWCQDYRARQRDGLSPQCRHWLWLLQPRTRVVKWLVFTRQLEDYYYLERLKLPKTEYITSGRDSIGWMQSMKRNECLYRSNGTLEAEEQCDWYKRSDDIAEKRWDWYIRAEFEIYDTVRMTQQLEPYAHSSQREDYYG